MSWKLTDFKAKNFEEIIGNNILTPLKAHISIEDEYLEINNIRTKFVGTCPFNINEVHALETINTDEELYKKLIREDTNSEEAEHLKTIISKNSDLFFQDGQKLSHSHTIQYEIVTTTDKPIYSEIYRYPQIHEQEIKRQITEMV